MKLDSTVPASPAKVPSGWSAAHRSTHGFRGQSRLRCNLEQFDDPDQGHGHHFESTDTSSTSRVLDTAKAGFRPLAPPLPRRRLQALRPQLAVRGSHGIRAPPPRAPSAHSEGQRVPGGLGSDASRSRSDTEWAVRATASSGSLPELAVCAGRRPGRAGVSAVAECTMSLRVERANAGSSD
jgi:hypothetical protein